MHDSGEDSLLVPGFNSIPIEEELPPSKRFAHGINDWRQIPAITLREFAITSVINKITDFPKWDEDVLDNDIPWQWYNDLILSTPLLSEKTWEWCREELKDKALQYEAQGFVRVLDTGSCVCKADRPELLELSDQIRASLSTVYRNVHSNQLGVLHSCVDPLRNPLIYGQTRVLNGGDHVLLDGTISKEHHAPEVDAPRLTNKHEDLDGVKERIDAGIANHRNWHRAFANMGWQNIERYYWSYKYQCLPSDLAFSEEIGSKVQFKSPIRDVNLGHDDALAHLEKLISALIEPWNNCLLVTGYQENHGDHQKSGSSMPPSREREQTGCVPCRIITYGVEWENEAPEWFALFDQVRRKRIERHRKALAAIESLKKEQIASEADSTAEGNYYIRLKQAEKVAQGFHDAKDLEQLPEPDPELWQRAFEYLSQAELGSDHPVTPPEDWRNNTHRLLREKLGRMLLFQHPEPGIAFTYEQWRNGTHGGKAVVDMITEGPAIQSKTQPTTPHRPFDVRLQDAFRERGLQVIIRVDSIELTPDTPAYPGSEWELQGMKNERIVAIGVFAYDVENITESQISFRQETDVAPGLFQHEHDPRKGNQIEAISEVFGFDPHQMCGDHHDFALPFQEIGDVTLPRGRLIAFPNTMESRRLPFRLQDETRNGHHRWVTIMLVDPNYRLCSTKNVIPLHSHRQKDGNHDDSQAGEDEQGRIRDEMIEERRRMHYARYTMMGTFFFC